MMRLNVEVNRSSRWEGWILGATIVEQAELRQLDGGERR